VGPGFRFVKEIRCVPGIVPGSSDAAGGLAPRAGASVALEEAPGGLHHGPEVMPRLPSELRPGPLSLRDQLRRVAGATGTPLNRRLAPGRLLAGAQHLQDGVTAAVPEIEGTACIAARHARAAERLERQHVGARDVAHVDVVADARA